MSVVIATGSGRRFFALPVTGLERIRLRDWGIGEIRLDGRATLVRALQALVGMARSWADCRSRGSRGCDGTIREKIRRQVRGDGSGRRALGFDRGRRESQRPIPGTPEMQQACTPDVMRPCNDDCSRSI